MGLHDLTDSFLKGLGESAGKSVGDGVDNITKGLDQIANAFQKNRENRNDKSELSIDNEIMDYFTKNIKNIEIENLDENSEYVDILKWAAKNKCGDTMYMVKHLHSKNNVFFIFVFFGENGQLLLDKQDAQRCYTCKVIPKSIDDLFQGKSIFVQPFKK